MLDLAYKYGRVVCDAGAQRVARPIDWRYRKRDSDRLIGQRGLRRCRTLSRDKARIATENHQAANHLWDSFRFFHKVAHVQGDLGTRANWLNEPNFVSYFNCL
jgi:hypothetical protein